VRIIGGQWKRTPITVLDVPGLRPTPDRVRETLFNWLGQDLSGWRCLDLYAGTGALGFEAAGLSMALGAFLAGVLLAESEYRHEIEAAVEPFKGLLLGLFFISVGMSVDFGMLLLRPLVVLGLIAGLFLLKGAVLWVIARVAGLPMAERPLFILLLAQGGEFAFVLLGLGEGFGAMPAETARAITLAVALSMLATPFLLVLHDKVLTPRLGAVGAARRPAKLARCVL
jgi:glutathione-regulated potassium-efflux system ancillary protein KefC